jgi:hypothetical protein
VDKGVGHVTLPERCAGHILVKNVGENVEL